MNVRNVALGAVLVTAIAIAVGLVLLPDPSAEPPSAPAPAAAPDPDPARPVPAADAAPPGAVPAPPRPVADAAPASARAGVRLHRDKAHAALDQARAAFDDGFDDWVADSGASPDQAVAVREVVEDFHDEVGGLLDQLVEGSVDLNAAGLRRELKGAQGRANAAVIAAVGNDGMHALSAATGFGRQALVRSDAFVVEEAP